MPTSMMTIWRCSLVIGLFFYSINVIAQTIGEAGKPKVTIIKPKQTPNEIKSANIDTERFEVGSFVGLMSLEDFDAVSVIGLSGSFHIDSTWMVSINTAKTSAPNASAEQTTVGNLIRNRDDGFQYLAALGSYEVVEGRSFLGRKAKLSSHIYVDAGVSAVDFLGDRHAGFLLGMTYKVVAKDWLTFNLMVRDHIVKREFQNIEKTTQNIEMVLGFNVLF